MIATAFPLTTFLHPPTLPIIFLDLVSSHLRNLWLSNAVTGFKDIYYLWDPHDPESCAVSAAAFSVSFICSQCSFGSSSKWTNVAFYCKSFSWQKQRVARKNLNDLITVSRLIHWSSKCFQYFLVSRNSQVRQQTKLPSDASSEVMRTSSGKTRLWLHSTRTNKNDEQTLAFQSRAELPNRSVHKQLLSGAQSNSAPSALRGCHHDHEQWEQGHQMRVECREKKCSPGPRHT